MFSFETTLPHRSAVLSRHLQGFLGTLLALSVVALVQALVAATPIVQFDVNGRVGGTGATGPTQSGWTAAAANATTSQNGITITISGFGSTCDRDRVPSGST